MSDKLINAQDVCLDKINQLCSKFGLNSLMAQLYAILYFDGKQVSLDEMVERLKVSKGSISVNIRALERYGVVRKVWVKGSRRDFYEAEMDIVKVVMDRVKSIAQTRLSEVENMLNVAYEVLNSVNSSNIEEKNDVKAFRQKLDELRGLYRKAQSLFNLLDSGIVNNILKDKTKKDNKKEILL